MIKMDSDQLLNKVRRRVLEEGNIEEALFDIFNYISEFAPLTKISIFHNHHDLRLVRIIAQAVSTGAEKTNFMYEQPQEIIDLACSADNPDIWVINHPERDIVGTSISERARLFDWSAVYIIFKNAEGSYANAMIIADEKDKFTEEHTRLLTPVREPLQLVADALIKDYDRKKLHPSQKEPVADKNEFFRQVTRRLCGHLDLKTGVTHCAQYLSRFLPADVLHVWQTEPELQSERVLAEHYGFFFSKLDSLLPVLNVSEDPQFMGVGDPPKTLIINNPERHPVAHQHTKIFGNDFSLIAMPLIHKKKLVGIALVGLEGKGRYKAEHKKLFEMLHDPFVLALSNNIKHREVIRLKNIIEAENKNLHEELKDNLNQTIVGAGLGLKGVVDNARLVAGQDSPVLLLGETGVGKEVVANYIHLESSRKDAPLIKVNCGAIPDTLVDSELFGHEKGAFTGATNLKKGHFERASNGTVFLDEIGELPPPVQVRLLRVIEHKVIQRVGGKDTIPVNIRIIAATHRNLEELVASREFREDLWFRLNVFPIRIPPLRARRADIPALVDHFIEKRSRELNLHEKPSLTPGAMRRLTEYEWPGNVRELENVIERELILSMGRPLSFENVFQQSPDKNTPENGSQDDDFPGLEEATIRHINKALTLSHGKVAGPGGAAELLQIKPNTLRSKMKKLGIPYGWKR